MQFSGHIADLFQHMKWADATLWRAVLESEQTEDDPRLKELLYHTHLTQHAFLQAWSGLPMHFPKVSDFDDLCAISAWGHAYHNDVALYLEKIEDGLDGVLSVPWAEQFGSVTGEPPRATTLAETMLQVALHSMYHRGQVNAHLRLIAAEPPLVDYIAWLWFGRPEERWPEQA